MEVELVLGKPIEYYEARVEVLGNVIAKEKIRLREVKDDQDKKEIRARLKIYLEERTAHFEQIMEMRRHGETSMRARRGRARSSELESAPQARN